MQIPHSSQLIVKVAFRNVRRNWRHSIAALATLAVGFLALALFQGYIEEFLRSQLDVIYSRIMIGEVMVQKKGAGTRQARINPEKYRIDEKEQQFLDRWIAANSGSVKTNVRTLLLVGMAHMGGSSAQMILWGHDVREGQIARRKWSWNTWAGHPLRETEPSGTVLALGLGEILGCVATSEEPVLDPITAAPLPIERPFQCKQPSLMLTVTSGSGRTNALEADVVGLTRAGSRDFDEHLLWVPLRFAQDLASTRAVSQYMIVLNQPKAGPMMRASLRSELQRAGIDLEVVDWVDTEGADLLRRGIDLLTVFRGLVFVVILIIAGAAVLTTMMKTVRERTREIGTLRSLGYLRRHILSLFAMEAAMLAVLAGAIGLLCSVLCTLAINASTITYKGGLLADAIPLRVGYSFSAYAWGFLFLSFVAIVAALLAARGVTRMRISEALSDG